MVESGLTARVAADKVLFIDSYLFQRRFNAAVFLELGECYEDDWNTALFFDLSLTGCFHFLWSLLSLIKLQYFLFHFFVKYFMPVLLFFY